MYSSWKVMSLVLDYHAPDLNSLHHTADSHWLSVLVALFSSVLHVVMDMFQCFSQFAPSSPSRAVSIHLSSMSASLLLHYK